MCNTSSRATMDEILTFSVLQYIDIDSLLSMRLVLPIALHYSLYNKDKAYRLN